MAGETPQPAKRPWHLWVVGTVSLLWNSFGAVDFVMTETRNPAYTGGFTPDQAAFYFGFPLWVVLAWGIAVWGGVAGSLLLLLRKSWAIHLFLLSLVGMVLTDLYCFVLSGGLKVMGGAGALLFSAAIFLVGVLLLVYSRAMRGRGLLD